MEVVKMKPSITMEEFEFLARESKGPHPDYVKACKAGAAEE